MRLLAALVALLLLSSLATGAGAPGLDTPVGLWEPLDGAGRPEGLIRIFESGGLYYGKIEPSSPGDDRNARCTRCTGRRHDQPIIGLLIMRHLRPENGAYVGGDILDPDTGHVYDCMLRLTDGGRRLVMRGFLAISLLGRSQIWQRVTARAR